MSFFPFNPHLGQKIQTDGLVTLDMAFLAHFQVSAAAAVALSANGVHAAMNLAAAVQHITTGITNPAVPRCLSVASIAGVATKVTIHGTNYAGEVISEELTLNGVTTVNGAKAFKTITQIDLPIQTHTPTQQVETQEYTHKAGAAGTITVTVTSAGATWSPKAVALEVEQDDTAIEVATKVVAALNDDEDIAAKFVASNENGSSATVSLTALVPAANDGTLAMAFVDTDTTGVTAGASTNATAGVAYDTVVVGWNDILGLPFLMPFSTLIYKSTFFNKTLEGTEPTITVSATAIESNTIDLNSALNGSQIDAYFIV